MSEPFLEWKTVYRLGVEMLDYEHQDLFARLNELNEELLRHDEREKIEAGLGEVYARLQAHFALEERFMREHKFPGYAEHKAEHDQLLDDFMEFMLRFERDATLSYGEPEQATLKHWVVDHVLTSDLEMGRFVASHPISGKP
ncbi:MAG: bacteriohemerythrin [Defluviicoccus sp.]|nr:bacteriohemerythrin [Defluviicoccus sp.]MDG4593507.1 bacteriohemerythrin [Defluviicoccus sp.]MDS4012148.1 bacteriohemerythrin [Defluviicoccus sp.]MDS4073461.1 bacteriohemerythrin [Defluviicoccus sp.]